jgi:hypothetical protein
LEIKTMGWQIGVLAIVTTFAFASDAVARTPSPSKRTVHHGQVSGTHHPGDVYRGYRGGLVYAPGAQGTGNGRRAHFADLVGDPESGYGFYPLPLEYRIGAWRYRLRHPRAWWENPVYFAVAADAARYNDWIPADQGYRYGVFNPIDGVGTPFFGGYYR